MADDREITIVIRGKNLTDAEFASARKSLAGVKTSSQEASASTLSLGAAFKALAPALSVAAIGAAAMKILDYAGKINDLSAQTGLTTRSIQEMAHAAKMTGASLDSFTNAAFKLGTNLAGGSNSVQGAVEKLGLSYDQLRKQSPDEQFTTITTALGGVENAQERNRLAVELFGKTAKEILPAIAEGYDTLARSALIAGDDQLKALDLAGDALATFWEGVMAAGVHVAGGFVILGREIGRFLEVSQELSRFSQQTATYLEVLGVKTQALPKVFRETSVAVGNLPAPIKAVSLSFADQERIAKSLDTQILASIDTKKAAVKTEKDLEAAAKAFAASVKNDFYTADYYVPLKQGVEALSFELEELPSSAAIAAAGLASFKAAVQDTGTATDGLGAAIKEGLAGVLATIPGTLARAFEGGGDWVGAAKSLASQFGATLGGNIGEFFGGRLGRQLGEAIGSLAGPLVGKIASLFTSANTAEVRKYNAEIATVQDTLLAQYGTLEDLEAAAQRVGLSFRENWGHQGAAGLEAFNTLAEEFKARTDEMNAKLAESNTQLGGLLTSSTDLGRALPQALRDSIQELIDLGLVTGDVAAQFASMGNQTGVDFQKMQEAAQRYGVDLGALGPQFQRARLHASAVEIINDFDLLTAGGADVGGVLVGMKDEINALVLDSIKFGTDIPANMQPWIEELLRSGQLVDENGVKMTDLSALQFSDPIKTQFEEITLALRDVVDSLASIASSIAGIQTDRTVTIRTHYIDEGPPEGFGRTDGGGDRGVTSGGYARGTYGVHGVDFPDFGSGQRVMVHHREAITPHEDRIPTAMRWLTAAGLAGLMAGGPAPAAAAPNVYIVNDTTGARQGTEHEFRQIQDRLDGGGLSVPVRAITQRGR